jgi:formate hydrogenlyase transcriptional activator
MQFKKLLIEISTFFINLPCNQIDSQIQLAQSRICELLDLDRSTLWQAPEGNLKKKLFLTHVHQPPGCRLAPEGLDGSSLFPWTVSKILDGQILAVSKMADLPAEAATDMENWRGYDTKSTVMIPLSVGKGPVFGVLTFASIREEKKWSDETIEEFQLIAQIFANALLRKQSEKVLQENQKRLSLAAESANAGLWDIEIGTGKIWVTPKTLDLFNLTPEEELTFESFTRKIHPDDLEQFLQAFQKATDFGNDFLSEYRVILPDGNIRWMISRGKKYPISHEGSYGLMGVSLDMTESKHMEYQLREKLYEIDQLKSQLEKENLYLREEIELREMHTEIVGRSPAMKQILVQIEKVAGMDTTVLLEGETGVGKELLARAVHRLSDRKDRPMLTVNCASLPTTLIESELFGREKGAYTGAMTRMSGRFEAAEGGTLFLDEIGELPQEVQAKLLRVLEEGEFQRVGSTNTIRTNIRIIAATNRKLAQEVDKGNFRRDLFYRLNVFPILIPPLRERPEDIPPLAWSFVRHFEKKMGKLINHIPIKSMQYLQHYSWPGNARELRNVIEYAMIVTAGKTLEIRVPRMMSSENSESSLLEDVERKHILNVLQKTGWRLTGPNGAAEILGLKRTTLQSKLKKLGISRPTK